ncbi:MAG: 50S ribosomal protein L6 [Clostridiales bacterium]|nr:50S ribosomal protein L6 [Clostridiales bacterium]
MSRIGKNPIVMPAGVTAKFENGLLTVNGPKGALTQEVNSVIGVNIEGQTLSFVIAKETADSNAKHGLYRALANNMVKGVSEGFKKTLLVSGVGYKVAVQGNKLVMNLGLSHPVELEIPQGLQVACPNTTEINVTGIDKQAVGQFASKIKFTRPVEPYHGYGIRYADQVVVRKVGKTAGKGKK